MPGTLPFALASVRPAAPWCRRARGTGRCRPGSGEPDAEQIAAIRWPRSVSISESDASRPTSISTNRNSIMIAPV